jgi:dodecin
MPTRSRREPQPLERLHFVALRRDDHPGVLVEARGAMMSDSVYRVTEVVGASPDSWEAAARNAVETAARSIRDLRVAEATRFDVTIQDGKIANYRVRLDISFKYEAGD